MRIGTLPEIEDTEGFFPEGKLSQSEWWRFKRHLAEKGFQVVGLSVKRQYRPLFKVGAPIKLHANFEDEEMLGNDVLIYLDNVSDPIGEV